MAGPCVLNDTSDLEELSKQQVRTYYFALLLTILSLMYGACPFLFRCRPFLSCRVSVITVNVTVRRGQTCLIARAVIFYTVLFIAFFTFFACHLYILFFFTVQCPPKCSLMSEKNAIMQQCDFFAMKNIFKTKHEYPQSYNWEKIYLTKNF